MSFSVTVNNKLEFKKRDPGAFMRKKINLFMIGMQSEIQI